MERARVFFVDGDHEVTDMAREYCDEHGHSIDVVADSLKDALEKVDVAQQIGIDVAVVDSNLSREDRTGSDGTIVAETIRQKIPEAKIIAFTAYPENSGFADKVVEKGTIGAPDKLVDIIDHL